MGREELLKSCFHKLFQLVSFNDDWGESWRDESVVSEINVNTLSGAISYVFDLSD